MWRFFVLMTTAHHRRPSSLLLTWQNYTHAPQVDGTAFQKPRQQHAYKNEGQGELAGAEETGCGGYSNSGRCVSSGSKNKPYHQLPHTVLSRHKATGIWARHAAVWWTSTAIRSQVPDESTFASKNDRPILVCRLGREPQLSIRVDICALWWCAFGLDVSLKAVNGSILRRMQLLCSNAVIQFQPDQSSIHDSRVVQEWPAFGPMSNLTTDTSATWNEPQGEYVAWGKDTRARNVAVLHPQNTDALGVLSHTE